HQVGQRRGVGAMQVHDRNALAAVVDNMDALARGDPHEPPSDRGRLERAPVDLLHLDGVHGLLCRLHDHSPSVVDASSMRCRIVSGPVRDQNFRPSSGGGTIGAMGASEYAGYCSFTKAIEHLGERWILLIIRELGL